MTNKLNRRDIFSLSRWLAILIVVAALLIAAMVLRDWHRSLRAERAPDLHADGAEQRQPILPSQLVHNSLQSPDPPSKKSIQASENAAEAAARAAAKIASGH